MKHQLLSRYGCFALKKHKHPLFMLDLFDLLDVCGGKIKVSTTFFFLFSPFVSLWWTVIEVLSHHVWYERCLTNRMHSQNLHDCWQYKINGYNITLETGHNNGGT
jgi:hypothetical protein